MSYYTGQLLECAEQQKAGSFWKGYNLMFNYAFSGRYTQDVGRLLRNDVGLNYSDLLTCANDANSGANRHKLRSAESGVTGTPAVMVRYNDGRSAVRSATTVMTYNPGGAPYSVLATVAMPHRRGSKPRLAGTL